MRHNVSKRVRIFGSVEAEVVSVGVNLGRVRDRENRLEADALFTDVLCFVS